MRRTMAIALAGVMLMAFGSASAAQLTETKLIGGSTDQIMPTINATYIAWSENSKAHPRRYNDYYETLPVGSGSPVRMNASNLYGYHPSFDGDGNIAVMQVSDGSDSNVLLYNLTNHSTSYPPN